MSMSKVALPAIALAVFLTASDAQEPPADRLAPGSDAVRWADVSDRERFTVSLPLVACQIRADGFAAVVSDAALRREGVLEFGASESAIPERYLDLLGAYRLPLVSGWRGRSAQRFVEPTSARQSWRLWIHEQGLVSCLVQVSNDVGGAVVVRGTLAAEPGQGEAVVRLLERIVDTIRFGPAGARAAQDR